ncbi:MAG: hypothetical protein WAP51_02740, partial [Candidatus Sungiibacteriota bacterium]
MAGGTGRSNRSSVRSEWRDLDKLSLWQLADIYNNGRHDWPARVSAEVAFALAIAIKREADLMGDGFKDKKEEYTAMARRYASECLMYAKCLSAGA